MRTHSHGAGLCQYTDDLCKAFQEQLRILGLLNLEHLGPDASYPLSVSERQVLEIIIENLTALIKGEK